MAFWVTYKVIQNCRDMIVECCLYSIYFHVVSNFTTSADIAIPLASKCDRALLLRIESTGRDPMRGSGRGRRRLLWSRCCA